MSQDWIQWFPVAFVGLWLAREPGQHSGEQFDEWARDYGQEGVFEMVLVAGMQTTRQGNQMLQKHPEALCRLDTSERLCPSLS